MPFGTRAPVDPTSGALSVGVPIFETDVTDRRRGRRGAGSRRDRGDRHLRPTGRPRLLEQPGRPRTPPDGLRTGDVGFKDADGWFYVVDRKKDQINASGYKVWPREVEDVLYEHPAVDEAAVVGVPDDYRGETVKAFVVLAAGKVAEPDDLIDFARGRLAAYKCPRLVEFVDELPKTATGKVLRRELRRA